MNCEFELIFGSLCSYKFDAYRLFSPRTSFECFCAWNWNICKINSAVQYSNFEEEVICVLLLFFDFDSHTHSKHSVVVLLRHAVLCPPHAGSAVVFSCRCSHDPKNSNVGLDVGIAGPPNEWPDGTGKRGEKKTAEMEYSTEVFT